jgi:hypothetical protein
VAEWTKATVLKTVAGESLPWVRILPPPPAQFLDIKNSSHWSSFRTCSDNIKQWDAGCSADGNLLGQRGEGSAIMENHLRTAGSEPAESVIKHEKEVPLDDGEQGAF